MESGLTKLLRSRKFWVLVCDTFVALLLYFIGKYAAVALEDVKFLITALQPVVILLIGAIAVEDAAYYIGNKMSK